MEEREVLVNDGKITFKLEGTKLYIGDMPQLIVDLETQENYIRSGERLISYKKRIELSPDLLAGKRRNVMDTALRYYYTRACRTLEAIQYAEEYREKANTTVREYGRKDEGLQ